VPQFTPRNNDSSPKNSREKLNAQLFPADLIALTRMAISDGKGSSKR
jgi:hypothetical protein